GLRVFASHQEAGAADPIGELLYATHPVHLSDDARLSGLVSAHEAALAKLVQGAHHAAEREFGAALTVHESRTTDRDVLMAIELVKQLIDRPGGYDRIVIEKQEVRSVAGSDADISRSGESQVLTGCDRLHVRPPPSGLRAAVRRRVVNDDDLVGVD